MITRNQERRFRIDIAIRDVMTKTFQHFLAMHILPADLINEIERRRHKHLSEEDKKTIQSGNFDKFDVTLLNKLFVNYGEIIFKDGLGIVCSKEMPYPNHITVSDDFNRLRIYRNKYVHQIHTENEDIAIEEMEGIKQDFIDICLRMKERNLAKYKKEEYVAQLQAIFNSDLDRIEELHKRVTNLERGFYFSELFSDILEFKMSLTVFVKTLLKFIRFNKKLNFFYFCFKIYMYLSLS